MPTAPDQTEAPSPFPLTDVDRWVLSQTDEQFQPHTWEDLKQIIAQHELQVLKRWPSDLKRYIKWSSETKAQYGSVPNFVMRERLKWAPLSSSTPESGPLFAIQNPVPFAHPADYKVLVNDWPYGLAPGIRHIIVWLKTRLESEPTKGDMTPRSRTQVESFVQKTFIERVNDLPGSSEKVIWFKNWTALQSVPGMEHVHVLVRDVPQEIIDEWTGGDIPVKH